MSLQDVIPKLRKAFADNHVDRDEILANYKSNKLDWEKYANFDPHKYTRNLVDQGNGKYNLMVLCWPTGIASQIHDHTDSHCFVKMLSGSLREVKFAWPTDEGEPMSRTSSDVYSTDAVSYMSDELGLHRMENPSHTEPAVSLHLYVPPYQECNAFHEATGKKTKCTVTFHSKYGKKVDYNESKTGNLVDSTTSISCKIDTKNNSRVNKQGKIVKKI